MASYNSHDRSKNFKNMKAKPTIYMVVLIIVVAIISITKAANLLKTSTKTVIIRIKI